jgi:hypothetical protein
VLKTKVDSSARLQFAGEANRSILMAFGVDGFGCSCLYYRSKNGGFVIAKHISKLALHLTETGQGGRSRTVADDVSETLSLRLRQPDFLNANHLGAPLARDPKLQSSYLLWGYLSSPFAAPLPGIATRIPRRARSQRGKPLLVSQQRGRHRMQLVAPCRAPRRFLFGVGLSALRRYRALL